MRDGLTHFEDWSRGKGIGLPQERVKAGDAPRGYWSFAYDPRADTVTMGPYRIDVGAVTQAAANWRSTWLLTRSTGGLPPGFVPGPSRHSPTL